MTTLPHINVCEDATYIRLNNNASVRTSSLDRDRINIDYDVDGGVVGIEIVSPVTITGLSTTVSNNMTVNPYKNPLPRRTAPPVEIGPWQLLYTCSVCNKESTDPNFKDTVCPRCGSLFDTVQPPKKVRRRVTTYRPSALAWWLGFKERGYWEYKDIDTNDSANKDDDSQLLDSLSRQSGSFFLQWLSEKSDDCNLNATGITDLLREYDQVTRVR